MGSTLLPPPAVKPARVAWPRNGRCDRCGETIVLARHPGPGRPHRLDPLPVMAEGPCGSCSGTGERRYGRSVSACIACGGTGLRGEPLDAGRHVLVTTLPGSRCGIGRTYDPASTPDCWEAAHRRRRC